MGRVEAHAREGIQRPGECLQEEASAMSNEIKNVLKCSRERDVRNGLDLPLNMSRKMIFTHFFLTKQKNTTVQLLNSCFFLLLSSDKLNVVHWEAAEQRLKGNKTTSSTA